MIISAVLLSVEYDRNGVLLDYSSMQGAAKITYTITPTGNRLNIISIKITAISNQEEFLQQNMLSILTETELGLMYLGKRRIYDRKQE